MLEVVTESMEGGGYAECIKFAEIYYGAVVNYGQSAFDNARKQI